MRKTIWIMNHYATNSYFNRGGRHYWFAKNLINEGYKVSIFCANTRHNSNDQIEVGNSKYVTNEIDNIPYIFIRTKPSKGNGLDRIKNMVYFYRNLKKTAKLFIKNGTKPDLILASSVHPLTLVAGLKIGKRYNIPVICEIRDLWPEAIFAFNKAKEKSIIGKLLIKGEHWIYKNADSLIFTKEGDTDYLKEKKWDKNSGGDIDLDKCYYINNGLDVDDYSKSVRTFTLEDVDLNSNKFKVVYAGAIRPVNNIDKLIEASRLLKNHDDIIFLIYGEGIQKQEFDVFIQKHKLDNVVMKGFVNKKYIPFILSKSSVNILNYSQSRYNWNRGNSSNKLFEYMASGKPIIATVKMGYSPFERYNFGIEIEDAKPQDVADAILKIKRMDKSEYDLLSLNAKKASYNYDFKKHTKELIKIINDNLEEKND